MDIPNLAPEQTPVPTQKSSGNPIFPILIIAAVAIASGFWLSRLVPISSNSQSNSLIPSSLNLGEKAISTDSISSADQLIVGKTYGNLENNFKDSAQGTIEKGSINGEGTHILNREGGISQRVSLTSSVVDLDLFVGKKVEVKGETNSSKKTAWLMDVGSVKLLE